MTTAHLSPSAETRPPLRRFVRSVEHAFHDPRTLVFRRTQGFIWVAIIVSVLLIGAEAALPAGHAWSRQLALLDRALLYVFVVELLTRVATFRPPALAVFKLNAAQRLRLHITARIRYLFRPLVLIDVITVLALVPALRGLRVLRLLRLLRSIKIFRYNNVFATLMRAINDNSLMYIFAFWVVGVCTVLGGLTIFLVEKNVNPGLRTAVDGMWWALVTLTTVGFGDITPITGVGRVVGSMLMVGGMFSLALFAGVVGHTLMTALIGFREEQFRLTERINHIVVCGYEDGSRLLLSALLEENLEARSELLIFAPCERLPDIPPEFSWVVGDPTKESELTKAGFDQATAAIIVGRRSISPQVADAITILTLFTIRSHLAKLERVQPRNVPLYIIAEILDAENIEHARKAGANEVVESTRLGFSLLTHAITEHGTGNLIARMASSGAHSVYVGALPKDVSPGDFAHVAEALKEKYNALVIGIRSEDGSVEKLNPDRAYQVGRQTRLVYLAERATLPHPS